MNIKLTDQQHRTRAGHHNEVTWKPGVPVKAQGSDSQLCTDGWIHFYRDPLLAVFMIPQHANIENPVGWEFEPIGEQQHEPLKSGARGGMVVRQVELPAPTIVQRVAFAILCAKAVYNHADFNQWADAWLAGRNRTKSAAYAAHAADAAYAAHAAAYAAHAVSYAAHAAAYAAHAAATASTAHAAASNTDFIALAHRAMQYA